MTIINDDARVINKLQASLTDDARVTVFKKQVSLLCLPQSMIINLVVAMSVQL